MGDTNRVQLAYIAESVFGVKETGSNLQILRHTGESLKQDSSIVTSEELRADRQIANIVRTTIGASGSINFELSHVSYDDLLSALMMDNTWATEVEVGPLTTISAAAADDSFNDSVNGFGSFVANQWIYVSGFTNSENNGWFKIATVAAGKLTIVNGTGIVDETAGQSVTITQGPYLENSTDALKTFNFEKEYQDLTNILSLILGAAIYEMTLEIPVDGIITGSFGIIGSKEESLTASGGTGYDAATTTVPMSTVNDFDNLFEGDVAATMLSLSLSINNNLRARMQAGTLGAISIGTGSLEITGTLQAYFNTHALMDKYLNQTASAIVVAIKDAAGNGYVIDLPSVRFTNGQRVAGGRNDDVIADMEFSAFMNAAESKTIRIARFDTV